MQQPEAGQRQLPAYKSHKTVWALKIASIEQTPADEPAAVAGGTWRLIPEDKSYGPITVPHSYVLKHNPQPGGYYVVYADGYTSFSPEQAFEEGYAPVQAMSQAESASLSHPDGIGEIGAAAKKDIAAISGVREFDIRAAGADRAPRITPADIEANITSEHYFTAADGAMQAGVTQGLIDAAIQGVGVIHTQELPEALNLLTFCVLVLRNGFTVYGASGVASPENFNAEIGRKVARQKAMDEIGPLLGYELRSRLAANSMDFRDRVRAEKQDLDAKITRLSEFIASDKYTILSSIQKDDLHLQHGAMCIYSDALAKRIAGFANT